MFLVSRKRLQDQPMWEPMLGSGAEREERLTQIAKDIPMRKLGTPEDVAYAALFLASD